MQLAHILRAACSITSDNDVLVIGSQSILGSFDEDDLPAAATASIEADIAFLYDPDRAKADRVEGVIGEMSSFHSTNGYYAEGIHVDTAVLPEGWRDRLVGWDLQSSHPATPHFLEPHDLAISKLVAGREKDRPFVDALIRHGMLDVPTLLARNEMLSDEHHFHRMRNRSFLGHYQEARSATKPRRTRSAPDTMDDWLSTNPVPASSKKPVPPCRPDRQNSNEHGGLGT